MSVAKMLKGHELFRSLSFEEVERISRFSGLKDFGEGDLVFESGRQGSHFFVLQEGGVVLRIPAAAHEASLMVGHIENGEVFGLAPLLAAGRHTTSAHCTTASRVLAIEAAPIRALLEENCLIGMHIMGALARAYFSRYIEALVRVQRVVNEIGAI